MRVVFFGLAVVAQVLAVAVWCARGVCGLLAGGGAFER